MPLKILRKSNIHIKNLSKMKKILPFFILS
jgi:hypothetical protein